MEPQMNFNLDLLKARIGLSNGMARTAQAARAAEAGKGGDVDGKKWKAALDFQAMFLGQMYKAMRKSSIGSDLAGMSHGREIFTEMLDQEYARLGSRDPAEAGADGMSRAASGMSNSLAAQIYRALLRRDGEAVPPVSASAPEPMPFNPAAAMARALGGRRGKTLESPRIADDALEALADLASRTYGVAKNLIKGVIRAESAGRPLAVSHAGAKGLMQLMDATARELGVRNVFDARENVMAGTRYLKEMLDRFGGDERLALAAYNAGPAAVARFGGVPPFAETRAYVEKVLGSKSALDAAAGAAEQGG